jgi:carbamoyl-phosphate synthase small subunit
VLVLEDGTVFRGKGLGAFGQTLGEVCFNTSMTGYQEILTDPSYAGQIITFTFPHIGNVGTNREDTETSNLAMRSGIRGCILRADVTGPSNYRSVERLDQWLKARGIMAIAGVDTRALTALIRDIGARHAIPVDRFHIVTHSDASPLSRSTNGAPWDPSNGQWSPSWLELHLKTP